MNTPFQPPQRKVVLRLSNGSDSPASTHLNTDDVDNLFKHARALGLPLHHDPQVAALLVSLRMSKDVPTLLYVAAAAVLASVYATSTEG
jgi:flagellar biosynthesis protein